MSDNHYAHVRHVPSLPPDRQPPPETLGNQLSASMLTSFSTLVSRGWSAEDEHLVCRRAVQHVRRAGLM